MTLRETTAAFPRVAARAALPALTLTSLFAATALAVGTERIASGLALPTYAVGAHHSGRHLIYILEQRGVIRVWENGVLDPTPFLDLDALVWNPTEFDERGLLGMAISPDFETSGRFYLHYTSPTNVSTITRFNLLASNPARGTISGRVNVITIPQQRPNHKGGWLGFGPDGYLWMSIGDDGIGGDQPVHPSQDGTSLEGKVLRLDVASLPYSIPPDNPFVGAGGFLDEIWAFGLRNPFRCSHDRMNGDFWIGDVGRNFWEEIDFEPLGESGRNYGWPLMEGAHCFFPEENCDPGGLTYPIHEYSHNIGCSVAGGYVYRGGAVPEYYGHYFYADLCTAEIWSFLEVNGVRTQLTNRTAALAPGGGLSIDTISSLGEDANGELLFVDYAPGPSGEVYRLVGDAAGVEESVGVRGWGATPNPFVDQVTLELAGEAGDVPSVSVYSADGRRVRLLNPTRGKHGSWSASWDGREAGGRPARPGVYFARGVVGGVEVGARLVKVGGAGGVR